MAKSKKPKKEVVYPTSHHLILLEDGRTIAHAVMERRRYWRVTSKIGQVFRNAKFRRTNETFAASRNKAAEILEKI